MFDSSLRTPLVYAIAVRYQTPLWRAGALLRAGCMAGFWVLLLWFPAGSAAQGAAMLALGSVGAVTAWAHNRSSLLDFLVDRDIPGLSAVARHLIGARQRAAADLSGLLEGFGIISVALLFAGPVAVRPLPAIVYELGTVLIVVHVWSAFLQAMTDSSWYSPDVPPGRAVLLLRPVMPLIVAAILFAILGYPIYWEHEAVPGGLFGVILACAVVLLMLPFTLVYELILRAARDALGLLARRYRAEDAVTVHSLVKNAAYALISEVDGDPGAGPETRALAREMLALTEEANRAVAFERTFMVSALTGDGLDDFSAYLAAAVPPGPWLYPEDEISDSRPGSRTRPREKIPFTYGVPFRSENLRRRNPKFPLPDRHFRLFPPVSATQLAKPPG